MFLKSLEIRGFKSFADKIELQFENGITSIVGPNGSGKSNISDCVRWVLGEQSVKSLRGSKMEDVIFAGTQFRKALGFAQVSITIKNEDNSLPIVYNEVLITRRIFRSGETEYLINNQKCRLKDITELFMDTGIGKEGYSLIGQGKIDAILSGKSDDRRGLFEEAAGIVKYKARKEEAQKRLFNTDNNLIRIRDIISTYEERIEPLKLEKEKAKKFQEYALELKENEVSLIVFDIKNLKDKIYSLNLDIKEKERELAKNNIKLKTLKEDESNFKVLIENLDNKTKEDRDNHYNQKELINKNISDIEILKERIKNFDSLINKELQEIDILNIKINSFKEEIVLLEDKLNNEINNKITLEKSLEELNCELITLNKSIFEVDKKLSVLNNEKFKKSSFKNYINNNINQISKEINEKYEHKQDLQNKVSIAENSFSINNGTLNVLKNNIELIKTKIKNFEIDFESSKKEINKNKADLIDKEIKLKEIIKNIDSSNANYKMLNNLEKHYEGYNRTIKILMEHINNNFCGVSKVKLLGEVIEINKNYELAIEIALGTSISNIITEDDKDAKSLINYLKLKKIGRATFLPLNIIKGKKLNIPKNIISNKGYIGVASDLVICDFKYKNIIEYSLGRTIIVNDLNSGLEISKLSNNIYRIVTLGGELISPGGSLTGGSIQGKNINLLGRKREIEELKENIKLYEAKKVDAINEIDKNILFVKSLDEEVLNKREEIYSKNIELTVLNNDYKNILNKNETLENNINILGDEIINYENLLKKLALEKENDEKHLLELEKENIDNAEQIKELEDLILNDREKIENLKEKITEIKINLAKIDEIIQSKKSDIKVKNISFGDLKEKISFFEVEIKNKKDDIIILNHNIKEKDDFIKEKQKKLISIEDSCTEYEVEKIKIKDKLKIIDSEIINIFETIRICEGDFNKSNIILNKLENDNEHLVKKLNTELNLSLAEAIDIAKDISDYKELISAIDILKQRISSLGNVNLSAIVEFDELIEKYEFMFSQETDLKKAKLELTQIISDMTDNMRVIFKENFDILNENFSLTFKELFKGGSAELILEEGDELLSNIIINVQPPGKKLQNINLMSGGEKVLSAIALLFAILKMKPTPFCILDEIEAALDDANVFRYAEFLKRFSSNIQFIVITHRKGTMEASDIIYGVTMEEKGVSKVVSIDLSN